MLPSDRIVCTGLRNFPLVKEGDDIPSLIRKCSVDQGIELQDGDIFAVTQKIISKAEGRLVDLRIVKPGSKAVFYSAITHKDPRLLHLILDESKRVLRARKGLIIVKHRLGFVCANAGIDHSNSCGGEGSENYVLLLPKDPDLSARLIREYFNKSMGLDIGVLIIDSHGRAWRNGTIGTCIGLAGVPGVIDLRGKEDLFGYRLRSTFIAAADEMAAGASLLMGQSNEARPVIHIRGFPYESRSAIMGELIRPEKRDLFL